MAHMKTSTKKVQTSEESLYEIGKNAYASIAEKVKALTWTDDDDERATEDAQEKAIEAIREDALSCEVRGGWVAPMEQMHAEEFRLLLGTGGPAVRIIGTLSQYGEPDSARLETQNWGTPWTEYVTPIGEDSTEETLLAYARCFYFGEGGWLS
jgi:hypothetical protein